jgi:hypothetical protein
MGTQSKVHKYAVAFSITDDLARSEEPSPRINTDRHGFEKASICSGSLYPCSSVFIRD